VGKTVFSAALIRFLIEAGHKVAGLKPIASGFERVDGRLQNEDVRRLSSAANVALPIERVNRYAFEPAIAPHIAAADAGIALDLHCIVDDLQYAAMMAETVVVEGVGGWLVPLGDEYTIESLAAALELPIILVVGLRLGCLNHAMLTARAIQSTGLPFAGWVANHIDPEFSYLAENLATLDKQMPVPRLFDMPYCDDPEQCVVSQPVLKSSA